MTRTHSAVAIAASFGFAAGTAIAAPGDPLGPLFLVPGVADYQSAAAVAAAPDGRFVAAWNEVVEDPLGYQVIARRFSADGTPAGAAFPVNDPDGSGESVAGIAMGADGRFVVSWIDDESAGAGSVRVRTFDAAGNRTSGEVVVVDGTDFRYRTPGVAMAADGDFVVAWEADSPVHGYPGATLIRARRFDADARPAGDEIKVGGRRTLGLGSALLPGTFPPFALARSIAAAPSVAMDDDGDFVVAWAGSSFAGVGQGYYGGGIDGGSTTSSVFARRFDANGKAKPVIVVESVARPSSPDFAIDANYTAPDVAMDANGNFAVAWIRQASSSLVTDRVMARRYSASGVPSGLVVSRVDSGAIHSSPKIAMSDSGTFAITWSHGTPGTIEPEPDERVLVRHYRASGLPSTDATAIEPARAGSVPNIASDRAGHYVVVWRRAFPDDPSDPQSETSPGLAGQRFAWQ